MSEPLPPPAPRPKQAQMFMAMPLLFGAILMASVLVLAGLVWVGGTPDGERVTISLQGDCAATAEEQVRARITGMGLGTPELTVEPDALVVSVTLPGIDPERERAVIPGVLGQSGRLEVRDGDTVVLESTAVLGASLQLDENGAAMAVVELTKQGAATLDQHVQANPEGTLSIVLDGVSVAERPNTKRIDGQTLRIIGSEQHPRARMAAAADQVLVLENGPLPCGLTVGSVTLEGSVVLDAQVE